MSLSIFTLLGCPPGQGRQGCGAELLLPSVENVAILKHKKGGKCANTRRPVGHVPRKSFDLQFLRPVGIATSYGATALQAQKVSCHSRKKAGQKSGQHVPEEVLHGVTSFWRSAPRGRTYTSRLFLTTLLRAQN